MEGQKRCINLISLPTSASFFPEIRPKELKLLRITAIMAKTKNFLLLGKYWSIFK
jgi:hypothetical protein